MLSCCLRKVDLVRLPQARSESAAATAGVGGEAYASLRVRYKYLAASEASHCFSSSKRSPVAAFSDDGSRAELVCTSVEGSTGAKDASASSSISATNLDTEDTSGAGVTASGRRSRPTSCKTSSSTVIGSASVNATGSAEYSARMFSSA